MFLLDTNACIKILNSTSTQLVSRLKEHHPSQIKLSSVVKAELIYGARKSAKPARNLRILQDFFEPFRSLAFDDLCAGQYGVLRTELERTGKPVGPHDMMIAATAIAHDLIVVTHNQGEFSRIAGLKWEDWEA